MTSAGVAVYLWLVHVVRALTRGDLTGGVAVWVVTGLWTLTLTLATFALVYTIGWLIESVAALTRARRTAERLLLVAVASAVVARVPAPHRLSDAVAADLRCVGRVGVRRRGGRHQLVGSGAPAGGVG